jgi:hypothetical protein
MKAGSTTHTRILNSPSRTRSISAYYLGRTVELQAGVWYKQHRLEEARTEALRAADVYDKLGAAR